MKGGILIIPTGTITPEDRAKANEAGYCVIECDKPESVRLLTPETGLPVNDLTLAALGAMQGPESLAARGLFAQILYRRLSPPEKPTTP